MNKSFNRKEARNKAEEEAKHSDMKQHADKLIQGFEKLEENHAKRAIWELFQNAIDLSEQCEVIITITEKTIEFKHNGKPFTANTLSSLIKQVSSKKSENNDDEVGQYGTGFITTHSFGKNIILSGALQEDDSFIHFHDFEINRIAKNSDELITKLTNQQNKVFDLVENGELEKECPPFTTFTYQTISDLEKQNAKNAILELSLILPYVMTINKKLQKVIVIDSNNNETIYQKSDVYNENDLNVTPIQINKKIKKIYSLSTEQNDLTIILPLEEQYKAFSFDENLSKLFLFYPLIGTENFGFNFLLHSNQFAPTEPRDGIHLFSKNEQIQEKEKNNRILLDKTLKLLSPFIEKNCIEIQNIHFLAKLNFKTTIINNQLLYDYFKLLKKEWVDTFKCFSLVETNENKISPEETLFFSNELLYDEDYFNSIYAIVSLFWQNIPKKEIVKKWTEYVSQWEDEDIKFIDINQVAEEIKNTKTLNFYQNTDDLKNFYEYLIKYNHSEVFDKYEILPNVKNEFRLKSQLNSHLDIDNVLIEIADVIIPDIPKRYLNKDFGFSLSFEPYERKQFIKDMNAKITEYNVDKNSLLENHILRALIKYCSIFPSLVNMGTRGELLKLVIKYYDIDQPYINLSNLSDTDWWQTPIRCLFRNFIWEINTKEAIWIEENVKFLNELLSVVHNFHGFKEDIIQTLPLFPNQQFRLCKQSDLKVDNNIPEELKNLYDEIVKPTKQIRDILILNDFGQFLKNGELKTPEIIGSEIENKFDLQNCNNINQHEHIVYIVDIIRKISDNPNWAKYFTVIESKKASIMLERISDDETKNDLFSIIGLETNKIALLGDLSRQKNLEKIIQLGKDALAEEQRNISDFQFKHTIGTHIEKLVREKIGADLISFEIKAEEKQGGQDIIVRYNSDIVYYIEVKSRWDNRSSITMSALQMKRAVENQSIYSLCCVEMSNYKVGKEDRYNVSDINEIINSISVLSEIGNSIEPLLSGVLAVKDIENEVSLTDYRGVIPQSIVTQGIDLDSFVNNLIGIVFKK